MQRARHRAVAVRLDPSGGLLGDGEQLREGAEDAVLAVVLVAELAQDVRELLGADVAGEFVLDPLEGELGNASQRRPVRGPGGCGSPAGAWAGGEPDGDGGGADADRAVQGGIQFRPRAARTGEFGGGLAVVVDAGGFAVLDAAGLLGLLRQYRWVRIFAGAE